MGESRYRRHLHATGREGSHAAARDAARRLDQDGGWRLTTLNQPFTAGGDLPVGVHRATLSALETRFGMANIRRQLLAERLRLIHDLARSTGAVRRFVVFGSFVTAKTEPNDVDVFLVMEDAFDVSQFEGEAAILFDHAAAQAYFGASVFWVRRLAAFEGEDEAVAFWQLKRDGGRRGIVEVVPDDPE